VTNRCPFKADSLLLLLEQQRAARFVRPRELRPDLPAGAEAAIKKALSYNPAARFVHAKDFSEAFAQSFQEEVTVADLPVVRVQRKRPLWAGLAALLLVFGMVAVWYFSRPTPPPEAPPVAPPVAVATRQLSYSLLVRKNLKSAPVLADESSIKAGSQLRLLINSPQDGFLYVLNESLNQANALPDYVVMYPEATNQELSTFVRANQSLQLPAPSNNPERDWFRFEAEGSEEKIWLIWSEFALPELEAIKHLANPRDLGVISQKEQIKAIQEFFAAHTHNKPAVVTDDVTRQTKLSTTGKLLLQSLRIRT
jgi:hypothetical protein